MESHEDGSMLRIAISSAIDGPYALGASRGQMAIREVMESLRGAATDLSKVELSFEGVEETNASFVKSTLLHLVQCGRLFVSGEIPSSTAENSPEPLNCFPAVSHCSREVLTEIEDVFKLRQLPFCELTHEAQNGEWIAGALRGYLDLTLVDALKMVTELGSVTPALLRNIRRDAVAGTAWNNRLEALHSLRVVHRLRVGREWQYQCLFERTTLWVSGSSSKKRSEVS